MHLPLNTYDIGLCRIKIDLLTGEFRRLHESLNVVD